MESKKNIEEIKKNIGLSSEEDPFYKYDRAQKRQVIRKMKGKKKYGYK